MPPHGDAAPEPPPPGPPSGSWPRPADVSSSGTHPTLPTSLRPPALASTMLEEDIAPRCPGQGLVRRLGLAVGLGGAAVVAGTSGAHPVVGALAVGLALAGGLGASPMAYDRRARWLLALSATVATGALGWRLAASMAPPEALLRVGTVVVLSTAMLHRAHHRGSAMARALAVLGLALATGWLATDSGLGALAVREDTVAGWTPALLRVGFVAAAGLGALVFMSPSTTAGTERWWPLLPLWLLAYEVAGAVLAGAGAGPALGAGIALAAAATLFVVAAAQRLAARDCGERAARRASLPPSDQPGADPIARAA